MKKYLILLVAVIVLIGASIYGHSINKMDEEVVMGYYQTAVPEAAKFEEITDRTARYYDENGQLAGYVGVSSDVGYGGPLVAATVIDPDGNITAVTVVDSKETPAYIKKITSKGYFKQYESKTVSDSLVPLYDIDCVSGATLSSRAIGNSVRDVAHSIATSELGLSPEKAKLDWQVGIGEIAVALLFVAGLVFSRVKKLGKYRLVLLLASIVILGFWMNRSLSSSHISALLLGYLPAPQSNIIWYLVLIGAIVPALITGKNFYCTYMCPFCGVQEVTHMISKVNLPLGKNLKWIRVVRDILLFAVIFIAFLTLNPAASTYEPFGTIFGLNGSKFGWYLLFVILVVSFIFKRFWCTAFCPVGAFLDKIAMISRDVRKKLGIGSKKANKKVAIAAEKPVVPKTSAAESNPAPIEDKKDKKSILLYVCYAIILICIILVLRENILEVLAQ